MTDLIRLLPDSVANQIAAGEVIQRPASVVKELVENSVDAGAGEISVLIRDSGKTLIQVADNGSGMSETDARLSFERHATSKITTAQDLFAITTKGFRGEALASIAAVAMVELKTRRASDETGTLIVISGSKTEVQEPCSCPVGSVFSVKNLFFNIPARRKFLKSDNTEIRHIINEFQKIALAHPDVRFTLTHNNTEIYNLPPANLRQRIIGVFGKQINNELITVSTDTTLIKIGGFIGKPENARRTYGEQFFFVNRRFMKHPYFHKAVAEAYQNILPAEAIPSYFIFMEADPASIDINIHPTKTEIKFEDERAIWQILMASVREALGKFNIVPSLDFENEALIDIPVRTNTGLIPGPPSIELNAGYDPFRNEHSAGNRQDPAERFERENTENWERLYNAFEKENENPEGLRGFNENERRLLQVKNKYIVAPVKSGLMLIDQKRAHERVLYEKFIASAGSNEPVSQADIFPVTVKMDPADYLLLEEIDDYLRVLGFVLRFAGDYTVIISGRPADSINEDPVEMLEILLEEYKKSESDPGRALIEKVAAGMAGASAIPYGKPLSRSEMENLFDMLFSCSAPNYSPGGKPVISIITLEEVDKRFRES
ncbi:MAG: DNA mismatch repair endonuclease MutL [Bacteroidales bacterium]|jgi:DNA mismatch repair protein MutL|nr:DNA mismatch repair endonuclease MutL [Bacteroidales bacterium]MCU0407862.1 DNA mismatch repair endonuclease MutL [Bacteroidales bacterium]